MKVALSNKTSECVNVCFMCLACVCVFVMLWIHRTEGEIPRGASGEVIFSPSRGCQSLNAAALDSALDAAVTQSKTVNIYSHILCLCVCIPVYDMHRCFTHIICLSVCVCV